MFCDELVGLCVARPRQSLIRPLGCHVQPIGSKIGGIAGSVASRVEIYDRTVNVCLHIPRCRPDGVKIPRASNVMAFSLKTGGHSIDIEIA